MRLKWSSLLFNRAFFGLNAFVLQFNAYFFDISKPTFFLFIIINYN